MGCTDPLDAGSVGFLTSSFRKKNHRDSNKLSPSLRKEENLRKQQISFQFPGRSLVVHVNTSSCHMHAISLFLIPAAIISQIKRNDQTIPTEFINHL